MSALGRKLLQALKEDRSTWELYKDKPLLYRLKMWFYLSDLFEPIQRCISFYNIQKERINRLYAYGKHIWTIGEFDHSWHLQLQLLSLKRLHRIMRGGNHVWSKTADRKMVTCIQLLERMTSPWESYHEPADEAFRKRWNFQDKFELLDHPEDIANPRPNLKRWYTSRDAFRDSLPPVQQKRFDREYKEVLYVEDRMYKQDCELFTKLWSKHHQKWWD